ncbi:MAG: ATP-binding protein [Candidatus Altiarchaeota archaeon]
MKQITVISGKGGTGKTSLVGAFAALAINKVLADCDVDASDLHLLLNPTVQQTEDFTALKTAVIDHEKCIHCGKCINVCRFDAISDFIVDRYSCEGCGSCQLVCPEKAIKLEENVAGKSYISDTRFGPLCHARLFPGEDASGKLVAFVRNNAKKVAEKKGLDRVIIDGSPGIGCPVIASIGGTDLTLIVTEPTVSGIHDLERILGVTAHFKVPAVVVVNKFDINPDKTREIENYCNKEGVDVFAKIPYDPDFTKAMVAEKTIIEYQDNRTSDEIKYLWGKIKGRLDG